MSWTEHDACTEETFVRYMCVMHLYIDGASPQWFKKKFDFAPTTIHTIVSNVRNWLVTQLPGESIAKPREMREQQIKYHKLLNALETRRTNKEPTLVTDYPRVFAAKRTFGHRKGSVRAPSSVRVLNLPKTKPVEKPSTAIPLKALAEITDHLLTAAAEISEGRLGELDGIVLVAVANGTLQMTKVGLSNDEVYSTLARLVESKVKTLVSVFETI